MAGPAEIWQQAADNFDRHVRAIGPAIEVAEDASEQDRLLGFTGRRP